MSIEVFSRYVASRRVALGLSQEQVGDIVGVSKASISEIESAKPKDIKASTLIGLARALRWTPQQIFLAYDGKDPDSIPSENEFVDIENQLVGFLKGLPPELLARAFRETHTKEELKHLVDEAKRRKEV